MISETLGLAAAIVMLPMLPVIAKLKHAVQRTQEAANGAYAALVRDVANGKDVRPADAEHVLSDAARLAGKTLGQMADQLAADVQRLFERRGWADAVRAADAGRVEAEQLVKAEAEAIARYDAAVAAAAAAFNEVVAPVRQRLRELRTIATRAEQARGKLMETAPAEVASQLDAVRAQINELLAPHRGRNGAPLDPRRHDDAAQTVETWVREKYGQYANPPASAHQRLEEAKAIRARGEIEREQLANVQARLAELQAEEARLLQRQLEP